MLKHDIAGDPMSELKWTHKTPQKIAEFERQSLPIISVDSKKKEQVGNFKNPGRKWDRQAEPVNNHDFRSLASGIVIPYGIYDYLANRGSIFVGVSHDTPAFAVNSIAGWWQHEGTRRYRQARKLLILADSGGSNGYRCRAWKTELQAKLANPFGLTLTVAHYPAGTSKWNPIEHRLFSEISKNWAAEPLTSYDKVLNFIRTTKTRTGLTVSAYLDSNTYPTGIAPDEETLRQLRLRYHNTLPQLNYTISPKM